MDGSRSSGSQQRSHLPSPLRALKALKGSPRSDAVKIGASLPGLCCFSGWAPMLLVRIRMTAIVKRLLSDPVYVKSLDFHFFRSRSGIVKANVCGSCAPVWCCQAARPFSKRSCELPDGNVITVNAKRFFCAEVLFSPAKFHPQRSSGSTTLPSGLRRVVSTSGELCATGASSVTGPRILNL